MQDTIYEYIPDEGPSLETSIFPLSFQVVREPLPNWLVAGSKLHKHRGTCCIADWFHCRFATLCFGGEQEIIKKEYAQYLECMNDLA